MDMYILLVIVFSSLALIFTELYLRLVDYANSKESQREQDRLKLFIYPLFLILILGMCITPDYLPKSEYNIGILTFLPFFNVGTYLIANFKRSASILHQVNDKDQM